MDPTSRDVTPNGVPVWPRFRLAYAMWRAADGWYERGRFVRGLVDAAGRWLTG